MSYVKDIKKTPPEEYLKNNGRDYHTPLVLGSWLDVLCLGLIAIVFALWIAHARKRDNAWVRALIFYSAAMAILATVLIQMQVVRYLVISFGFYGGIGEIICTYHVFVLISDGRKIPPTDIQVFRFLPAVNATTRVPATVFFGIRAWRLHRRSWVIPTILTPLVLLYLVESVHASVVVTAWVSDGIDDPSTIALLISALCEVLIDLVNTIALYTGLRKLKTGWKRTDALLSNLIHLTIETQLPPLLVAVAFAICNLVTFGGVTHYFVFLPKVHIICLLLVVNRGLKTRQEGESSNQVEISRAPTNLYVMPDSQQTGEPASTSNLIASSLSVHQIPTFMSEKGERQQV